MGGGRRGMAVEEGGGQLRDGGVRGGGCGGGVWGGGGNWRWSGGGKVTVEGVWRGGGGGAQEDTSLRAPVPDLQS